ncbi:MAG: response regulator [Planctomycetota bacterium]
MAKKRILVVEDDANIRNIIQFLLDSKGYEVITAATGPDGLQKAKTLDPDLILLDVMLPGKNGFEICYEIKNDVRFTPMPIIILTATTKTSAKPDEYWKVRSRADDFITKPFKSADLLQRVENLTKGDWRERKDERQTFKI